MKHLCIFSGSTKSCQLNPNEKNLPWKDVQQHIEMIGWKIIKIPSNGHCLLLAIKQSLDSDFQIQREDKNIARKIWKEIKDRLNFYREFTTLTPEQLMRDAHKYLSMKKNTYTLEVVDVIVFAAANALNINIKIWENDNGFLKVLAINPSAQQSPATIHLMFTWDKNPALDPLNTNSHYDSIVTCTKSQPDYNENYLDETQISDEHKCYNAKHPGKTFSLEMDLFAFVVTRKVPQLPYNCDGVCKFEISCPFHLWKAKVKDGCYWHTNWSSRQKLDGIRRLCKCHGSLACTNKKCPTFQIHRTPNRCSFKLIGGVTYKCKVCGHIAEREWCGTKRAIEYNKSTSILTVWHQGKHTCILKCQSESKEEKEAKKDLLTTVLKIFPRLSNAKLIDVGSQYYIQQGYPEVAKEFVQACTDKDIVSESRRESYNELLGFDQHSVHAVSIVKNKMDTVDPFYIYVMYARVWGRPRATRHTNTPPNEEAGLPTELS